MNTPFKKKGVDNNRKLKWVSNSGSSNPGDTVDRVLCPWRKIGGVVGKGGNIVKALREETEAKIRVGDLVLGCDERVIIIYSSPLKVKKHSSDEDSCGENEKEVVVAMEPCCVAQYALLKVHGRIVEDHLFGGMASDDDNGNNVVTARLLVLNNMV
ncbi:KH domain-containing protein At4g18375-like [Durio zibethinus]|uniref:KH domain-containing protein At4g18375-like n=1 Tax=Durio zibethinus TaxID=66656 RepID=A0A6P6B572_DURZI|nr:KH domain-containing protein At4g18375-like [Durio zibethinus]XP_022772073.1 KH domain-containing protein At4g18375-like [Durio zibethinus]XP_022772074.1 KH domain-containing protein At4g18375-like [Durio zibethinus]XP_022772075.1 KH domain-containing protein At4g18375-like [Durio zibethinus]XP_022772076.1 KH domain-containing protein At4g18375-like [Durio zibethinus]